MKTKWYNKTFQFDRNFCFSLYSDLHVVGIIFFLSLGAFMDYANVANVQTWPVVLKYW